MESKTKNLVIIGVIVAAILVVAAIVAMNMGNKTDETPSQTTTESAPTETKKQVTKPASFSEGYEQVEVGMSREDVAILLGEPMAECKTTEIKQLNQTMTACSYKDPANTTGPTASLPDVTVDFDDAGLVMQKQKY